MINVNEMADHRIINILRTICIHRRACYCKVLELLSCEIIREQIKNSHEGRLVFFYFILYSKQKKRHVRRGNYFLLWDGFFWEIFIEIVYYNPGVLTTNTSGAYIFF